MIRFIRTGDYFHFKFEPIQPISAQQKPNVGQVPPNMNVFFDLPEDHQKCVLTEWLVFDDLVHLDSALCWHKLRQEYLDMIKSPSCVFGYFSHPFSTCITRWTIAKHMKFREVVLNDNFLENSALRADFLRMSGHSLEQIEVDAVNSSNRVIKLIARKDLVGVMADIAKYCVALRNLSFHGSDDRELHPRSWDNLVKRMNRNPQLEELLIDKGCSISAAVIIAICNAPNLTDLDLPGCSFSADVAALSKDIVSTSVINLNCLNCLNAQGVRLSDLCCHFPTTTYIEAGAISESHFVLLPSLCPQLNNINVRVKEEISDASALQVALNLPQLQQIKLQFEGRHCAACSTQAMLSFIQHCPLLCIVNLCNDLSDRIRVSHHSPYPHTQGYMYHQDVVEQDDENEELRFTPNICTTGSCLQMLFVDSLSEYGLRSVLAHCKYLETLGIYHRMPYVHPDTVTGLTEHCRAAEQALHLLASTTVKNLRLKNFTDLCDNDLLPLCNLNELFVAHRGALLTNDAFIDVARHCPDLHSMCIEANVGVDSTCVVPILQLCPKLESFEFFSSVSSTKRLEPAMLALRQLISVHYPLVKRLELQF